jgi:hypothetical protein
MNSIATIQVKSRKRTSPSRKKPPAPRRRAPKKPAEPLRFADWVTGSAAVETEGLPGWQDLGVAKNKSNFVAPVRRKVDSYFEQITTGQFALFILAVAFALGLYVSHVFATQEALANLERLKRENLQLQLQYNQMKGELGREISPTIIYRRAKELGLEEDVANGPAIYWDGDEEAG